MAMRFGTVDEYIAGYPEDIQLILQEIRHRAGALVPDDGEKISYQMPTVTMEGRALVYYAAWKLHIGMYPIPPAGAALESRIAPYRAAKDAVKFPYKKPIPYELIDDIVALLVRRRIENENDPQREPPI